jgi:UDP-N-acetylglucosamine acyltransferase
MAGCHVGHNSAIGNFVRIANGSLLGGHVIVQDYAIISGNCLIHQFSRIGTLAMMQGGAGISMDLPPFTMARGNNRLCGLNVIGLRRAGFSNQQRLDLKRLYRLLFRASLPFRAAVNSARDQFQNGPARVLLDFVAASDRGVCRDISHSRNTTSEDP